MTIKTIFPLKPLIVSLNHDQAKVIRLAVKHKTLEFNNAGLENHPFNANTYEIYICLSGLFS